jgi:hypothetical protein
MNSGRVSFADPLPFLSEGDPERLGEAAATGRACDETDAPELLRELAGSAQ